jgi:hypothetical protein
MASTRASDVPRQPADMNAPFFDIPEVAWLLKVSVRTVRRRIAAGYPHSQAEENGNVLVSREDLAYYYEATRVAAPAFNRRRPARKALESAA